MWPIPVLNALTVVAFVGLTALVWRAAQRYRPGFPLWTLGFPIVAAFLLTGKAYSPAYSLWLLPWFVLAVRDKRLFAAFSIVDLGVFVTVFQWSAGNLAFWVFELATIARAIVLVISLMAWVRGEPVAVRLEKEVVGGSIPVTRSVRKRDPTD
jgi:hypothetical protein